MNIWEHLVYFLLEQASIILGLFYTAVSSHSTADECCIVYKLFDKS